MADQNDQNGIVQFYVPAVDPEKKYLGDASVVHALVSEFSHAVIEAYDKFLAGESPAASVEAEIQSIVAHYGDVLMGRDPHYQPAEWQGERQRGKFLAALPAMKGDDDPGKAFFGHYALQCVKSALALANGMSDAEVGKKLAEILDDARGRLLGVIL